MSALQESRRELMVQLEGLMKLLKVRRLLREARCLLPFPGSGVGCRCAEIPALLPCPDKYFVRNRRNLQKAVSVLALRVAADG